MDGSDFCSQFLPLGSRSMPSTLLRPGCSGKLSSSPTPIPVSPTRLGSSSIRLLSALLGSLWGPPRATCLWGSLLLWHCWGASQCHAVMAGEAFCPWWPAPSLIPVSFWPGPGPCLGYLALPFPHSASPSRDSGQLLPGSFH